MAHISAILTAAGESIRMGRPKPLLLWHGVPLVEYQIASLLDAGVAEVVVVLGDRHELVSPHVRGRGVQEVLNPHYRQGKTTSIKAGLLAVGSGATAVLLIAVDQPRPTHIISTVTDSHLRSNALITSPRHLGRGGHPLVFSAKLMGELQAISDERQGIREVFRAHWGQVNEVPINDPVILLDFNSPEAYEAARARYGS